MKPSHYLLAALGLALLPTLLWAEEATPRRVLILTNETTLVGRIEPKNGQFEVRTDSASSLIPSSRVLKLCDTPEEAYGLLKQRANPKAPADRLRLARWCVKHGLTEQARQEAEETLKLQPSNLEAQRIVKAASGGEAPSVRDNGSTGGPLPSTVTTVEHSYSAETLRSFAQKVQPMLVNSCGTGACHGGAKETGFELHRPAVNGQTLPNLTRQNLVQTLKLIDKEDSPNSVLLRKALEAHGGHAKPPLPSKDAPAYQTLEAWVLKTAPVKEGGTLGGEIVAVSARSPAQEPEIPVIDPTAKPKLPAALEEKFAALPSASPDAEPPPVGPPSRGGFDVPLGSRRLPVKPPAEQPILPKSKTTPQDPFDPVQFNEVYHPRLK